MNSEQKNKLGQFSLAAGVLAYLYMIVTTAIGSGENLPLTTFGLWSALAFITSFTTKKEADKKKAVGEESDAHVIVKVTFIYGVGSLLTTLVLLIKGRCKWSTSDSIIAALVVIGVALWLTGKGRKALVMSIVAAVVAAIPLMQICWSDPANSPIIPNAGFLLANTLAFFAAKTWNLEDRLYAGVNIGVCGILVLPWLLFKIW